MSEQAEAGSRLLDHPDADRFLAALRDGGWPDGEVLPGHTPGCYGCGSANPSSFGLRATVDPAGGVRAELAFDRRYQGAPGLVHGGALAAVLDDLYGMVMVRELLPAVTVDLGVRYRRPVHLDDPCVLTARLVERDGRDLQLAAEVVQHEETKVTSTAQFRIISPERMANRYEPTDR